MVVVESILKSRNLKQLKGQANSPHLLCSAIS